MHESGTKCGALRRRAGLMGPGARTGLSSAGPMSAGWRLVDEQRSRRSGQDHPKPDLTRAVMAWTKISASE